MATIFRVEKTKDYTVMSNHHLRNKDLSLKAKGLLCLMLSLPENWNYTLSGLTQICGDGLCSIRSAVDELEAHGYISQERERNAKGQLMKSEYIIREQPQKTKDMKNQPKCDFPTLENPTLENPTLENPTLENRTRSNTNVSNTNVLNINQSVRKKFQLKMNMKIITK